MADWNLRLVLNRIWGDRPVAYRSWAVAARAERRSSAAFWRRYDVDVARRRPARRTSSCSSGGSRRVDVTRPRRPYKGLSAFEDSELDALLFFGREREREIVVANLIASRLTVLYGPSGVGKSSLLRAAVARSLRELPEEPLVVVFSRWGDDPARGARRRRRRGGGGSRRGALVDVARARAGRPRRLPDPRPGRGVLPLPRRRRRAGVRRGARRRRRPRRCASTCSSRCARTRSRSSTASRARIPSLFANTLRLDRLDRAAGARGDRPARSSAASELDGRAGRRRGRRSSSACSTRSAPADRVGARRARGGRGRTAAARIEAPYLQLVMQRLWEDERARGRRRCGSRRSSELGGAQQIVAEHLERAIEALTPGAAGRRRAALQPPRHAVGHQDRARGVRPRRVRRRRPRRDRRRCSATLARAPDPAHRRERALRDLPRRPRRPVLGWRAARRERAVERARAGGAAPAPPPGVPGLRRARRARARHRARPVFAFSQRSEARDQARVARGAASSSRARSRCSTATPSSGWRSPWRRRASSRRRGRRMRFVRRSTPRASGPSSTSVTARRAGARPLGLATPWWSAPTAVARLIELGTGRRGLVASRRRRSGSVRDRTDARSTMARRPGLVDRLDAKTGKARGRAGAARACPGTWSELVAEPRAARRRSSSPASRERVSSRWRRARGSAASSSRRAGDRCRVCPDGSVVGELGRRPDWPASGSTRTWTEIGRPLRRA